jgi:hypothetical protein
MRAAKEAMISEFGQTPAQLFDENQPHPARAVLQPVPTQPLQGYCGAASTTQEISHTLVHILLEVSASEPIKSVLSVPQPKPPPSTPSSDASSPQLSDGSSPQASFADTTGMCTHALHACA